VLLHRTPYGKGDGRAPGGAFIQKAIARGYAVFVQDVRGRYASDGDFDPYRQEGRDGYDTVEWIATQPWSNGRIGTYGVSYPAATQWLLAVEAPPPPHLRCICICDGTTDIVSFLPGHLPALGQAVSAGFLFDVPVRFDTDYLEVDLSAFAAGAIPKIPLVEIRP
jgi:hypothetical protein